MALDLTLNYRNAAGQRQWLHAGDPRPDRTMTLLVSEDPAGVHKGAAVQLNRDEAKLLVDHLRQAFGIGRQELREIHG